MPNELVIVGLSVIVGILVIYSIILKRKLFNISKLYVQASMNSMLLQKELENANNLYGNDDFLKFLTVTRENAFQYIEEVQQSIRQLQLAMITNNQIRIKAAYQNLLKHLPKEEPELKK